MKEFLMEAPIRARVQGLYRLQKGKRLGGLIDLNTGFTLPGTGLEVVTGELEWIENIVTDNCLNKIAANHWKDISTYCHVGTGTAAEDAADVSLQTFLASTNTILTTDETAQASPPYYGVYTRTWEFGEGVAEGILAELGISDQATTGDLVSRARIKDGGGSPTTLEILEDEWLRVTYQFRLYPDHVSADDEGSVSYSGVSYDYTLRAANVSNYLNLRAGFCGGFGAAIGASLATAYGSDAALGAVTSTPTGTSSLSISGSAGNSWANASYSNGTFARDISLTVIPGSGNTTGGIKALIFHTGLGSYQVLFDPIIPKTNLKQWVFVANLAWTRATIP